jgi:hypothetical protein
MEYQNAFLGKTNQPEPEEIDSVLAGTAPLWHEYIRWLAKQHAVREIEWKSSGAKYGWSVRLKLKKRTIVYISPANGCFQVSFVLGDRAVAATQTIDLPAAVRKVIAEAPKYGEGTGLRLLIRSRQDIPVIQRLAEIKLAN